MRAWSALVLVLALVSCIRNPPAVVRAPVPPRISSLDLAGESNIMPLERFPPVIGLLFGGISGLAPVAGGAELLGISDDREGNRIYRLRVTDGASFAVTPIDYIALERPAVAPVRLDPEGIAVLANGHFIVASEGQGKDEPRIPPALVEYSPHGHFVRHLPVRERFVPNPRGPLVRGVRSNMGFESLTIAPGGRRLFTATETALAQDGEMASFDRGAQARLLEYVARRGTYAPAREFVYAVDPVQRPPFEPDLPVNGLVELLAIEEDVLLALERSYVEEAGETGRGANRIRLYRIELAGATDVSGFESLRDATAITPLSKQLLLDLSDVAGLSSNLTPGLDNFEGMCFGPRLADGRKSLILVSDDNFNPTQRTWFLLFAVGRNGAAQRLQ